MILPARADRGIVVFHAFPSMDYGRRLAWAFGLLFAGIVLQVLTTWLLPGILFIAAANFMLLVRGYDNRVDLESFDAAAEWERVDRSRLDDLEQLHKKMRRWDRSALDITNPLGGILFVVVGALLGFGVVASFFAGSVLRILLVDAAVLLLPHWVTGVRGILTRPKLMVRVDLVRQLLDACEQRLAQHRVHVLMLLKGEGNKMPDDVKLKVDVGGAPPDFLGLYGQVVINEVQGTSYPYFYVVLVAKKGYGLAERIGGFEPPANMVLESSTRDQVEVVVLRQRTTKTSGYHTKLDAARDILEQGVGLAERAAGEGATATAAG